VNPTAVEKRWRLIDLGCGTVGVACLRAVFRSPAASSLEALLVADRDRIHPNNAVTCPEFTADHRGRPKVDRMAELVGQWQKEPAFKTATFFGDAEDIDWRRVLAEDNRASRPELTVVLCGLDDWQSRLIVVEDLRTVGPIVATEIVCVQVGLDRDQAVVGVFANAWDSPCPACNLSHLPQPEPCIVFSENGRLLRGDLRREARAAAEIVARIVTDCVQGGSADWLNTKTTLAAFGAETREFNVHTRPRVREPGCLGPHGEATPVRWDRCKATRRLEEQ